MLCSGMDAGCNLISIRCDAGLKSRPHMADVVTHSNLAGLHRRLNDCQSCDERTAGIVCAYLGSNDVFYRGREEYPSLVLP